MLFPFQTPGLRANMQRLNYYCQSFIERGMVSLVHMYVFTASLYLKKKSLLLFLDHVNFRAMILWKCIIWSKEDYLPSPWTLLLFLFNFGWVGIFLIFFCNCILIIISFISSAFMYITNDADRLWIKEVETYKAVPSCLTLMMHTIFTSKKWRQWQQCVTQVMQTTFTSKK